METCIAPDATQASQSYGASRPLTPTSARTNTSPTLTPKRPLAYTARKTCRVCGSGELFPYIRLGMQPLANALRAPDARGKELRVPLTVAACPRCKLSQLTHVVSRDVLYKDYVYYSGANPSWKYYCAELAHRYGSPGMLVMDIASNDGTLLKEFAERGCTVRGIEPATNFADCGVPTISAYWSAETARQLRIKADVITAQNVLGHVDDVHDFMEGIVIALKDDGVAVIEVPYLLDLFDACAFDTIYHEHLSYWTMTALTWLADKFNLVVRDVHLVSVHGGSLRVELTKTGKRGDSVLGLLAAELHDINRRTYLQASERITQRLAAINRELAPFDRDFVGYGAAAKATVMINSLDVRAYPRIVYDDSPHKYGKLIPGTRIPIEAPPDWHDLDANWHDPLVIFAWNWSKALTNRIRSRGFRGPIFVPLPEPRWEPALSQ